MPLGQVIEEPREEDGPPAPETTESACASTPEVKRHDWFSEIGRWRADVHR